MFLTSKRKLEIFKSFKQFKLSFFFIFGSTPKEQIMAEFLTTNGISYQIENIIIEARTKLVLVSPYLQLSKTFYERLKDVSNKKIPM